MVLWHTDIVHAVEAQHRGQTDSSVMYIPAIPLTRHNWDYVSQQRHDFLTGIPPADFPGGAGEEAFLGRAGVSDIQHGLARSAMGFEPFSEASATTAAELALIRDVNLSI